MSENPSCQAVYTGKHRRVCTELCAAHRNPRPAHDDRHCFRMLIAIDGHVGFCLHGQEKLDALLATIVRRG